MKESRFLLFYQRHQNRQFTGVNISKVTHIVLGC